MLRVEDAVRLVTRAEKKPPNMRTEQEKIALMGRPRLGDVIRAQVRIKESKEFKVSLPMSLSWNF